MPEKPPDAGLEEFTRQGLTPAQAYQAQVYRNNPLDQQNGRILPKQPAAPPEPPTQSRHASVPLSSDMPRLGLNIETDDGKLGIDFGEANTVSDQGTEEGSSELPWATSKSRGKTPSVRSRVSTASAFNSSNEQGPLASSSNPSRPYPLQVDTSVYPGQASTVSTSPTSFTLVDSATASATSARRSSESSKTLPGPAFRRDRATQDRSRSMSAVMVPQMRAMIEASRVSRPPVPSIPGGRDSPASHKGGRRTPIVYPALLSRVAEAFKARILLSDRVKDDLTYKDCFDGREAVDKIAYIIKTTDRNLALLLGRALDAQKFFHAVTYDHRLRDSASDLYQFRTKLPSPFVSGELDNVEDDGEGSGVVKDSDGQLGSNIDSPVVKDSPTPSGESEPSKGKDGSRPTSPSPPDSVVASPTTRPRRQSSTSDEVPLPSGVFTLLTDCYSPTCSRDHLCYSIACPRRLEQQARLNMKPQPGLKRGMSRESLTDIVVC